MSSGTGTVTAARAPGDRLPRLASALGSYVGFVPAVLLLGLCFLVPLGIVVCYSFWDTVDYAVVHHWTLGNYRYFFSVGAYVSTMWATLWVAVLATVIAIGLAFPFAYWLSRYVPRRVRTPLLVLVIVPFWASYLLRVYSWLTILGEKGVVNRFLHWAGLTSHPLGVFLYDRPAVILVLVYLYFPFGALTLYSSIERFDWNQLRAAMDLGASPLQAILRILVPQIRPGIITAVIFVFIPILGEYLTPQIVGGTGGVMIGNLIVNFFQEAEYTRGAAISLLVAGFIVVLLFVFRKSLSTKEAYGA
ncbi:MAG TPA: ABC transporter permease [Gaiellaceae bacterium]|nr:ABC transporter permease [Gaiellaceae bacterium]